LGQESDVQRYLVFEDEGHDVLKMKNRVVCYGKTREFFASRLKNA
jgi:dipeptidyl aminopeptidase/acylaminoacyl peptidase